MVLDLLVGFQPVIQFTTWFVSSVLEELIRSDTNELRDDSIGLLVSLL